MNTEEQVISTEESKKEEGGFSFGKILKDMKKHKRTYIIGLPIAFVLAAIYALSIPNYYKCSVKLAPELTSRKSTNSILNLASSFGLNLGNSASDGEALFPTLYPELINSVTFRASLFPIMIHRKGDERMMTYYDYLLNEQKSPWWSGVIKSVFSIFGSKQDNKDNRDLSNEVNTFRLTKEQSLIVNAIGQKVVCDVDNKTLVITIDVVDQDPLIAATIADSVQNRLQDFITTYRTNKARVDVEHYKTLYAETKERYEKAVYDYAVFCDHNQKAFLQSVRSEQTKLETELGLRQQAYSQMAAQLQAAEAKLQEETPAFTTLQPATVPLKKAGPGRAKMCLVFVFLAFLATTCWILYKEDDLKPLLGLS